MADPSDGFKVPTSVYFVRNAHIPIFASTSHTLSQRAKTHVISLHYSLTLVYQHCFLVHIWITASLRIEVGLVLRKTDCCGETIDWNVV